MKSQREKIANEVLSMISTAGVLVAAHYLSALLYAGVISRDVCRDILSEVNKTSTKIYMRV